MDAVLKNGISAVVEVSQDIFLSSLHGLDTPTLPLAKVIPMVTDMATGVVQDSGRSKVIQVSTNWNTVTGCSTICSCQADVLFDGDMFTFASDDSSIIPQ